MQKFFCDLCDAEIPAYAVKKEREYTVNRKALLDEKLGRTVIVQVKIKQGEVCEACAKKVVMEGQEHH